jgi:tetratricopeptide (TPR) repeat protein
MPANQSNMNRGKELKISSDSRSEQILALKEEARKNEGNYEILSKLGQLLVKSQKFDEAVEVYQKICDLDPSDPRNNNSLGVVLMIAGYQVQSIEYLAKAVRLGPNNLTFKANLGKAHMMARQWREAIDCFDSVLSIHGAQNSGQLVELKEQCMANLQAA